MMEEKLKRIKAVVFDVDGVLTDGSILAMPDGDLLRIFDTKDAFAVRMAKMNGLHTCIITGGSSESVVRRFSVCGIDKEDIYLHSRIKLNELNDFCTRHLLKYEEVMYFGDDLPDIPVMKACGLGVAPADAVDEVKEIADYVSPCNGGRGCVRQTLEMLLKFQGRWNLDEQLYKKLF